MTEGGVAERRLRSAFWLALTVILLLVVTSGLSVYTPAPPSCSTAVCDAANALSLVFSVALFALVILLGVWAFRGSGSSAKGTPVLATGASPLAGPFVAPPSSVVPLAASATAVLPPVCPACGSPTIPGMTFCARCGRYFG